METRDRLASLIQWRKEENLRERVGDGRSQKSRKSLFSTPSSPKINAASVKSGVESQSCNHWRQWAHEGYTIKGISNGKGETKRRVMEEGVKTKNSHHHEFHLNQWTFDVFLVVKSCGKRRNVRKCTSTVSISLCKLRKEIFSQRWKVQVLGMERRWSKRIEGILFHSIHYLGEHCLRFRNHNTYCYIPTILVKTRWEVAG